MTKLISPENKAVIPIQTAGQREAVRLAAQAVQSDETKLDWLNLRRSAGEDNTFPEPAIFVCETDDYPAVLEISTDRTFESSLKYTLTPEGTATIDNLMSGREYFWRVGESEIGSFTTEDCAPRWIRVGGCSNVRDIGGWKTPYGGRVKQGLIYRGSEMDTHHEISEEGLRTMNEELCIRTDLDLRGEAVGRVFRSPIGADVNFMLIPAAAYIEFMSETQRDTVKELFEVLSDEERYPIYFHCWGGADRTGTLTFLLNAVLGVSEEDLLLDYELTSLSIWGTRSRNSEYFAPFYEELMKYDGETVREKTECYLRTCGVTSDCIERLRRNLTETAE